MELRHLRYFLALAEAMHFTRAADRLNITQSTLSHQILQLESHLGATLLHRTGRAVRLTEAGRLFRTYAKRILEEVSEATLAVNELDLLTRGAVSVGVSHTFCRSVLMPSVLRFMSLYPGIRLAVHEGATADIEKALTDGQIDFGVGIAPHRSAELQGEPLFQESYVLVVGDRHAHAGRRQVAIRDAVAGPLAMLTQTYSTRRILDAHLQGLKLATTIAVEANSVEPILDLVRQSGLAAILPRSAIHGQAGVHGIEIRNGPPKRGYCLIRHRTLKDSLASATLIGMIRETCRSVTGTRRAAAGRASTRRVSPA